VNAAFYLYFPRREQAQAASDRLRVDGFEVDVRLGADDASWLALAEADLDEDEFERAVRRLTVLAEELGGEYDGHERALRDDDRQS
jgi:hypothetical protein